MPSLASAASGCSASVGVTSRVNIGAGGSDLSFGADVAFHYEVASTNRITLGLKLLGIDYEDFDPHRFAIDSTMVGLSVGYLFD